MEERYFKILSCKGCPNNFPQIKGGLRCTMLGIHGYDLTDEGIDERCLLPKVHPIHATEQETYGEVFDKIPTERNLGEVPSDSNNNVQEPKEQVRCRNCGELLGNCDNSCWYRDYELSADIGGIRKILENYNVHACSLHFEQIMKEIDLLLHFPQPKTEGVSAEEMLENHLRIYHEFSSNDLISKSCAIKLMREYASQKHPVVNTKTVIADILEKYNLKLYDSSHKGDIIWGIHPDDFDKIVDELSKEHPVT